MRYSLRQQSTIAREAIVDGFGYWSGQDVRVQFCPAPPDTGIVFVRSDGRQSRRVPAAVGNRIEMPRRTTLAAHGTSVQMVEHIMAALAGLRIDNCEVHVSAAEAPGCDGSSLPFVSALRGAGIVPQAAKRLKLIVTEVTRVGSEEAWVEARPARRDGCFLKYRLDYGPDSPITRQTLELEVTPETFCRELAPARTFLLKAEADWLRSQGLAQRVTLQDVIVYDASGPLDNPLRFEDECVRHKALDLVGDLALAGCDLVGQFVAYRSGHRLNADLVRVLLAEGELLSQRQRRRSA